MRPPAKSGLPDGTVSLRRPWIATAAIVVTVSWSGAAAGQERTGPFRVERLEDGLQVTWAGQPLLVYRSAETVFKPYVSELYTPSGIQLLLDAPADHPHHHGWMFALGVNDVNYWHESPGGEGPPVIGRQRGGELRYEQRSQASEIEELVITQQVDWLDGDQRPLLRESRRLTACHVANEQGWLLTWSSRLSAADPRRPWRLSGERYFGLGLRFVEAMNHGGTFFFAKDRTVEPRNGEENLIPASWCAYRASVDGHAVTVAAFGKPAEDRRPTIWFTMVEPFAYVAATLGLPDRSLEVPAGDVLELTYGLAICDGELSTDAIQRLAERWRRQLR